MNCHYCGARVREGAKFCTRCGAPLPRSPEDLASSGYQSVLRPPPVVEAEAPYTPPPGWRTESYPPATMFPPLFGVSGQERSIGWALLLTLITCGAYGVIWLYKMGRDIRRLSPEDEPHPIVDVLLTLATCGVWGVYLGYKYPSLINGVKRRLRLPTSELPVICLLLALFSYGFPPLVLVAMALVQNELNKLWQALRRQGFWEQR
ncbi:MAG TPA: DUF4234 domain-containing protein [Blastocatellia bacterium]|nr:DUF4234 domain-containing protein [Blastocatellia bacterium]